MPETTNNKISSPDNNVAAVDLYPDERFKELIEAGVFYGRKKTKTNPRMRPFILATRNNIEIINLQKTLEGLEKALVFLKEKFRNKETILLVGTQPQASDDTAKLAEEFNLPLVNTRWPGGLLTNFKIISKRVDYYKKLKSELQSGALEKYTKKERLGFEREIRRLKELFAGLENLVSLPGAVVVIDSNVHSTAIREARRLKIPIVAYVNTDVDPESVDYPVIGNTKARKSIDWFLSKVAEALKEAAVAPVPVVEAEASVGSASESEKNRLTKISEHQVNG